MGILAGWLRCRFYTERNTNIVQNKSFPDFGHLEKLSSNFVGVFEDVVIELSEKMLHTSNLDIHRRANLVLHRDLGSSKSV